MQTTDEIPATEMPSTLDLLMDRMIDFKKNLERAETQHLSSMLFSIVEDMESDASRKISWSPPSPKTEATFKVKEDVDFQP